MAISQARNVTRSQMLRGKNVPARSVEQAWDTAKKNKDTELAVIIARRENLPDKVLKDLPNQKDIEVKTAWLGRSDTSIEKVHEILRKDRREKLLVNLSYNRPEAVYKVLTTRLTKSKKISPSLAKAALHCYEGLPTNVLAVAVISGVFYENGDPFTEDLTNALYKISYDPEASSLILGSNPSFQAIQILAGAVGLNSSRRRAILDYVSKIFNERGSSVEKWCGQTLERLLEAPDLATSTVEYAGQLTENIVKIPLLREKIMLKLQNWGYGRKNEMDTIRKTTSLRKIYEYSLQSSSDAATARSLILNSLTPNKHILTKDAGGWEYALAAGRMFNDRELIMNIYMNYPESISKDKFLSVPTMEKEFIEKLLNSSLNKRKQNKVIQELTKLDLPKDAVLGLPWKQFALSFEGTYPYASESNVELFGVLQDTFLKDSKSAWETFYALADEHEGTVEDLLVICTKL